MISAADEAKGWLEALTAIEHRGRHDTWAAARDRAAQKAGIRRSYAKHLWDRWQDMKDVSGEAYRRLQRAYEAQCEKHERAADHYRALREAIDGRSTDEGAASARLGMVAVPPSKASAPRELHRD